MISVLLTVGALAIIGIVGPLVALASEKNSTYGTKLEHYIISHNPQDTSDVERLTVEFDRKAKRTFL
jgi:hypothetical protein